MQIIRKKSRIFAMVAKFEQTLRDSGRSVTTARRLLFTYIQEKGPITSKQYLDDNIAIADRASLYRTLGMFKQLGIIEERIASGRRLIELTDTFDSHHHHLTCNRCGTSIAITMPDIERALADLCKQEGFEVSRHMIEVEGVCVGCNQKSISV